MSFIDSLINHSFMIDLFSATEMDENEKEELVAEL